MKLEFEKVVEVLSKMKDDDFYFKNYAPEIIESYTDEIGEDFFDWCEENKGWINNYSTREKMIVFKRQRSNDSLTTGIFQLRTTKHRIIKQ